MGNRVKNNKGQSTIEFIMTFTAAVGFIFLFLKMAINYTNGYMVHHATYLAARAYLVADENRASPEEGDERALAKAKQVFTSYLPEELVSGVVAANLKANHPGDVRYSAFVGLWIEYKQKFALGLVGGNEDATFRSEAFLGREPSRIETKHQVCAAIASVSNLGLCDTHVTLDDNGG